jgi:hypothetical protein
MKLPRWLVVTLLSASVLAVLGAGAWWWVTWPARTVNEFFLAMSEERYDDAQRLYRGKYGYDFTAVRAYPFDWSAREPLPRTLAAFLFGEQSFLMRDGLPVDIERGYVTNVGY